MKAEDPAAPKVMASVLKMTGLEQVKAMFVDQYHRITLAQVLPLVLVCCFDPLSTAPIDWSNAKCDYLCTAPIGPAPADLVPYPRLPLVIRAPNLASNRSKSDVLILFL